MKMVGIADFKSRLSAWLDLVKSGEDLTITERGKPVAIVSGTSSSESEIDALVRAGKVRAPSRPLGDDFFERERLADKDGSVLRELLAERAQGR